MLLKIKKIEKRTANDMYSGKYFKYLNKYYKLFGADGNRVMFSTPGTYLDNNKDSTRSYKKSNMLIEDFQRGIRNKDYFFVDPLVDPIPSNLKDLEL